VLFANFSIVLLRIFLNDHPFWSKAPDLIIDHNRKDKLLPPLFILDIRHLLFFIQLISFSKIAKVIFCLVKYCSFLIGLLDTVKGV
jgi:hypothetical protein